MPVIDSGFVGSERGAARAEDAQGTSTQIHISPSILVYKDSVVVPLPLGRAKWPISKIERRGEARKQRPEDPLASKIFGISLILRLIQGKAPEKRS